MHGIKQKRIRRLQSLLKAGASPIDKRGRNTPGNANDSELLLKVVKHIESFPTKQDHYTSRTYEYLSEQLSVKKMWQLYLDAYPDPENYVKYDYYLRVFHDQFNLHFGRPQKSTPV